MRREGNKLRFSPSDLRTFLESEFAAWMDRWLADQEAQPSLFASRAHAVADNVHACLPDAPGEDAKLLQRRGADHERATCARLEAEHRDAADAGRDPRRTQAAVHAGRALVTHGRLERESFTGEPDFLVRVEGGVYEPWDAKLAKSVHPAAVVQLCAYAEMLEATQGTRPAHLVVVLGTGERVRIETARFYHYYAHLKRAFTQFHAAFERQAPPHPALSASYGRWTGCAEAMLAAADHAAGVAGIRRSQIKRLTRAGIRTMHELATSTSRIAGIGDDALVRLQAQARLQIGSRGKARPLYEVRAADERDPQRGLTKLPPASPLDVAFDLEGDPLMEGGLEYLFGAAHRDSEGGLAFADWWALDRAGEKRALEEFIDWVSARRQRDPTLHVYHYGAYEVAAMRRLASTHGTREREVDDLLRGEVFVDLYTIVRQGLALGTPSYSLKDVERLYDPPRGGAVQNAASCLVAYQRWLESGEPPRWQESPILRDIRAYNQVDCESTARLADWLRGVQAAAGIVPWQRPSYAPTLAGVPEGAHDAAVQLKALLDQREDEDDARDEPDDEHPLAVQLLNGLEAVTDPERRRVQELLAHLLGFHRREWKPGWWRFFDRIESSPDEMYDDVECLSNVQRTPAPPQPHKRGSMFEYSFDPEQDTKIEAGATVAYGREKVDRAEVVELDPDRGRVRLVPNRAGSPLADTLHLIRVEDVRTHVLQQALSRFATAWLEGRVPWRALHDFLHRRPPRLRLHDGGAIVPPGDDLVQSLVRVVRQMDGTTLSVQGPPGTGKTWTAARVIVALLREGRRVGVMANGHKTILHLMTGVARELQRLEDAGADDNAKVVPLRLANPRHAARLVKVGPRTGEPAECAAHGIEYMKDNNQSASALAGDGGVLIGGTAWAFARADMQDRLDYLFVDEAGQVSVANVVAAAQSAANIVLLGDQMQLPQPTQGTHPGDSGRSALEYLLAGRATVPPDFGVFLDVTWRLHPDVCRFVSDAVYEGRLTPHESTARQRLVLPAGHRGQVRRGTGVQFVPVPHQNNAQASREEVEAVHHLVHELLGLRWCDRDGAERDLEWSDILIVAPYNVQVYKLQRRLGRRARVGSVDRFQGLEAPVVIVSLCASSLDEVPRGVEFLLNRNRLNVAVSRAQGLALVVASPALLSGRVTTLAQMERVNFLCRLADYAAQQAGAPEAVAD